MGLAMPITIDAPICRVTGKYGTGKASAKAQAKRSAKRSGYNIKAYECPHCGRWHVGAKRPPP